MNDTIPGWAWSLLLLILGGGFGLLNNAINRYTKGVDTRFEKTETKLDEHGRRIEATEREVIQLRVQR